MKSLRSTLLCLLASVAFAAPARAENLAITSTPAGSDVLVYVAYPKKKTLGTCQTPCEMKIKTRKSDIYDYTVVFKKEGYIPQEMKGEDGQINNGRTSFHIDLTDIESIKTTVRLEKEQTRKDDAAIIAQCTAKLDAPPETNREAETCRRVPPRAPDYVAENGFCDMQFDVLESGFVENISVIYCSNNRLSHAIRFALEKWLFVPKMENNTAVVSLNQKVRVHFDYGKTNPSGEQTNPQTGTVETNTNLSLLALTRNFIADFENWNAQAFAGFEAGADETASLVAFDALLTRYGVVQGDRWGAVMSSEPRHSPGAEKVTSVDAQDQTAHVFTFHTNSVSYVTNYRYTYRKDGEAWQLRDLSFKDEDGTYLSLIWKTQSE